jgi:predicted nucleic acid-binding protein
MIAATSIVHSAIIVSHDLDFFALQRILPELHVIDWLEGLK